MAENRPSGMENILRNSAYAARQRQQAHALFDPVKALSDRLNRRYRYIALLIASAATVTPIFSATPSVHFPAALRCRSAAGPSPLAAAYYAFDRRPLLAERSGNWAGSKTTRVKRKVYSDPAIDVA
jgi:hypothetical protein